MDLTVVKRNKRLWIVDGEGRGVYTPPDFLRPHIVSRRVMHLLAHDMAAAEKPIDAIIRFERAATGTVSETAL